MSNPNHLPPSEEQDTDLDWWTHLLEPFRLDRTHLLDGWVPLDCPVAGHPASVSLYDRQWICDECTKGRPEGLLSFESMLLSWHSADTDRTTTYPDCTYPDDEPADDVQDDEPESQNDEPESQNDEPEWEPPPSTLNLTEELADDPKWWEGKQNFSYPVVKGVDVEGRWHRRLIDEILKDKIHEMRDAARFKEPLPRATLADLLADGIDPVTYRINMLAPTDGSVLISGPAKAGKTTLLLNLAKSLITGESFLGLFPTRQLLGKVGFWNYELSASQFADWSQDLDIPADSLVPLNLRGLRWDLMNDHCFEDSVAWCQDMDAEALIIDPYHRAYGGEENDNSAVSAWLDRLDQLKREAELSEIFLSAHFGRSHEERARGAQRLDDWADVIWNYVAEWDSTQRSYKLDGPRFFAAFGRDVEYAWPGGESVAYDPAERVLSMLGAGGGLSRWDAALEGRVEKVVKIVEKNATKEKPMSQGAITDLMGDGGRNNTNNRSAVQEARRRDLVGYRKAGDADNSPIHHWPK